MMSEYSFACKQPITAHISVLKGTFIVSPSHFTPGYNYSCFCPSFSWAVCFHSVFHPCHCSLSRSPTRYIVSCTAKSRKKKQNENLYIWKNWEDIDLCIELHWVKWGGTKYQQCLSKLREQRRTKTACWSMGGESWRRGLPVVRKGKAGYRVTIVPLSWRWQWLWKITTHNQSEKWEGTHLAKNPWHRKQATLRHHDPKYRDTKAGKIIQPSKKTIRSARII